MIQAIIKKGNVYNEEVPAPVVSEGSVLIKVVSSCISVGTELSSVVASGQPLIKRALEQPEKIVKAFNMVMSDGIAKTLENVKGEVEKGKAVGYSLSGVVIGTGASVQDFEIGDRVAAAGGGRANHAEFVDVPTNLVVKLPQDLDFHHAASVAIGAIAMQGIRRSNLQFGEFAVVLGSGIIGLLTLQMLNYAGIRTAVIDLDNSRLQLARDLGAEITLNPNSDDIISDIKNWSNGQGADSVLFTAATHSSSPLSQSFQMCKKKGKVILVGVSGMEIERGDIYSKELDLLISTSYGPGRYDKNFEEKNYEYPYAYVRWTERRNMEEYLRLLHKGMVKIEPLISNTFPIEKVKEAYTSLKDPDNKSLMVNLDYGNIDTSLLNDYHKQIRTVVINRGPAIKDKINVALVGAGNFATKTHLPNLQNQSDQYALHAICEQNGYNGKYTGEKHGAKYVTSNYDEILKDDSIDLIMICTRHDSHASLTLKGLQAGRNVFVEKPLATTLEECNAIHEFYEKSDGVKPVLMVGFNRRFSPYAREAKKATDKRINPLFMHYRMNAGFVPLDHWIHENGGRIVGEGCHIIDLMTYFTNSRIQSVNYNNLSPTTEAISDQDNRSMILKYEDGSVATIEYFAVGNKGIPKEYMEIHFDQKTLIIDDYKSLKGYGVPVKEFSSKTMQKGHFEELVSLSESLKGENEPWPIELWDLLQTTEISIGISK
jgi:predicted dehydrogenase/threonine dehydrogenase-like Zn-dependent dehydrogenase